MKQLPRLAPTALIAAHAADFSVDAFGEVRHLSYPIPAPGGERLELAFLCCPWGEDESGDRRELLAPIEFITFSAETGEFMELAPFPAERWALEAAGNRVVGQHWTAARRHDERFAISEARLYRLYDDLLPTFAAGIPPTPSTAREAAEFASLFRVLAEAPLAAWYRAIGQSFFEWVRRAASGDVDRT